MYLITETPASARARIAKLPAMAKRQAEEPKRYFVKLSIEHKRRLDHLAVEAGADSTEAFGGKLLAEVIDRLYAEYTRQIVKGSKQS